MTPTSHIPNGQDRHGLPDIFALVIGINNYAVEKLNCAVDDANEFEKYLLQQLKVPAPNITNLRDEQATRAAIISALSSLARDDRIKKDEAAIIIYFAGHGTRVEKPQEWNSWETIGEKIEMICPVDMGLEAVSGPLGEKAVVPGIPDRTISALLDEVSSAKGDNITVILDCCHAEGATRGATPSGYVAREVYNSPTFDPRIWDREILLREKAPTRAASGFSEEHQASHILLAAAGRHQVAYEYRGHGLFTAALLRALVSFGVGNLTYAGLMHRLNMPPRQTPHCKGQHLNRRLFNKKALGTDSTYILSKQDGVLDGPIDDSEARLTLLAGAAQGVTVGSKYGAYGSNLIPDADNANPCLATFTVTSVKGFSADLSPSPGPPIVFPRPGLFYSRLVERGLEKMAVYCADKTWMETKVFPPGVREASSVVLVDEPQSAELRISIVDGMLCFDRNHPLTSPHIGTRLAFSIAQGDHDAAAFVHNVVHRALDFNHHLIRAGDDFKGVRMELRAVKEDPLTGVYTIINRNLFQTLPAVVVVDEAVELHMNIINDTGHHLYPHLFYFDPSQLSIVQWYAPPLAAIKVAYENAPLPPRSQLTVGHGEASDAPPWHFSLYGDEEKDLGFFKLYLTTRPADLSAIAQAPPSVSRSRGATRPAVQPALGSDSWGSQLATVIQLRDIGDL